MASLSSSRSFRPGCPRDPAAAVDGMSGHATAADEALRRGFGPRVRRLHARIGRAHHQAEGMAFPRALLAGAVSPLQLAALIRALAPAYGLIEAEAPALAAALGAALPWGDLARGAALTHDLACLQGVPITPPSPAAVAWLTRLDALAHQAPHRLMAHLYVRYGGDLSGGQQLAAQANAVLATEGLPALEFWAFRAPVARLRQQLHDAFEALQLTPEQEEELLEEAELAFAATQSLLAELGELAEHGLAVPQQPSAVVDQPAG